MVIGTSANAHDFSVEHSELTHVISIDRSEEISQQSVLQNQFFDAPTSDFRIVTSSKDGPSISDENLDHTVGIHYRSIDLLNVQRPQFVKAARSGFKTLRLKKTLFPFHTFW